MIPSSNVFTTLLKWSDFVGCVSFKNGLLWLNIVLLELLLVLFGEFELARLRLNALKFKKTFLN